MPNHKICGIQLLGEKVDLFRFGLPRYLIFKFLEAIGNVYWNYRHYYNFINIICKDDRQWK